MQTYSINCTLPLDLRSGCGLGCSLGGCDRLTGGLGRVALGVVVVAVADVVVALGGRDWALVVAVAVVEDGWLVCWGAEPELGRRDGGPKWNDWQGKEASGWFGGAAPRPDTRFMAMPPAIPGGIAWPCPGVAFGTPDADETDVGAAGFWLGLVPVADNPIPIMWGTLEAAACAKPGKWAWAADAVAAVAPATAAADAGTLEIRAMKSSTIIRVLTPACPVCVEELLVLELVFVLLALPFPLDPPGTDGRCSPDALDEFSLPAPPLSVPVLILVPLVEVSWVLAVAAEPGCNALDMIVVRDIPPWGLTWILKFWLLPCGCWVVADVDWVFCVVVAGA